MTEPGLVVVGSGPAAVAAAASFREHDPDSRVQIFTADGDVPYQRPPLSKEYLRGETDDVALHPAQWFDDRTIELNLDSPVERLDLAERAVYVGDRRHPFDTLVLACGAAPQPPPIPGGHRALLLRSLADATTLRSAARSAASAVVIGSGFIGCEAAASLAQRDVAVTLVAPEPLPQEQRLGAEAAARLRDLVTEMGVRHAGGVGVTEITAAGVRLDNGVTIDCDLVLAATGVTPQSALAADAGLRVDDSRIVVGSDMATSVRGIYAAGDVALARHAVAGRHLAVEHWQDATDQGAIAGAAAAGRQPKWDGIPGFWTTIGDATLKYHAWGDGFESSRLIDHPDGFTVWYETDGATVGVLTYNRDDDYDLGERLIAESRPAPVRTG
ncbi:MULTISPECIES: NAD(P)/FAD-dependent oxidoreductase [Mycobacterium]|uniref:NAD(P)/FAD-dependent oxidoreductase n=1 Tax=Mycobacterium TaxID=1763 RepID=UPI001EEFEE3A|nr:MULTISPECIES: FAD-dependent oxidoreductase [Mycobacterium]GLB99933.1 pyridine nucleotide-disulfide oxidoreductase [Mycobacterium kiyosense]GLC05647.1 pyridine nucleotide-disulfide oxidoreductase [Mycobacterium kiyosense]GLC18260.1 pyridine nucleotide-disulfide oxidoreductase [Mycobacterium kiyosense]GLD02576.1 pyridine nucleotide-disulfide oxidoreductase [Mycobacterium kiyosense]GLD17627.1 pyridine nucleotide-disulfide oxidoreductase [Mycobacterium kiyosense]